MAVSFAMKKTFTDVAKVDDNDVQQDFGDVDLVASYEVYDERQAR